MLMTGFYRLALHPGADAKAFERHLTTAVFTLPDALQLTKITRSFSHQLLAGTHRIPGGPGPVNPIPARSTSGRRGSSCRPPPATTSTRTPTGSSSMSHSSPPSSPSRPTPTSSRTARHGA